MAQVTDEMSTSGQDPRAGTSPVNEVSTLDQEPCAPPARARTEVVLSPPGHKFFNQDCVTRFLVVLAAFAILAVSGARLARTVRTAGLLVLALGPSLVVIGMFYKRYSCSTNRRQIFFTFLEAWLLVSVLLAIVMWIDFWNNGANGRPDTFSCTWPVDRGGKAIVNTLSFAMHCEARRASPTAPLELVGDWDGLNCSFAPAGLRDGAIPFPSHVSLGSATTNSSDTTFGVPMFEPEFWAALQIASLKESADLNCRALAEVAEDNVGYYYTVKSVSLGGKSVSGASRSSLASAFDVLFGRRTAMMGGKQCSCAKSFHNDSTPAYDFCGASNSCLVARDADCKGANGPARCEPAGASEVTIDFEFSRKTVLHAFIMAYFRASLMEELLKYVVVRRILFKDRVVDSRGLIVYGLAAAAGFAARENVTYVLEQGILAGLLRMILAVPLHCCTGLIIGIHLGYRKFLGVGRTCLDRFVIAIGVPVLIHGTYDFFLMLPTDVTPPNPIREPFLTSLAAFTLVLGFVYCRFAWLKVDNVSVVHVKDMQSEGRVSKPRFFCCEFDCCLSLCRQRDPYLPDARAGTKPHARDEGMGHSESSDGSENSGSRDGSGSEGVEGKASSRRSALRRVARAWTQELLPDAPTCQTTPGICPECNNAVRIHILYPSDCPYCAHSFPDPAAPSAV